MTFTRRGRTMVIDSGLPSAAFTDLVDSHGDYIDLVKFGWGTAVVTKDLDRKTGVLRAAGIDYCFGGTLFEYHVWTSRLSEYLEFVDRFRATHIEVSNGTIPLSEERKAEYVRLMSGYRPVLAEVGYKDVDRSALLSPQEWVDALRQDLDAGAEMVITEARESGSSGIARADGSVREDVLGAVLAAVEPERVVFEAPTKRLQVRMIRAVGPAVNLGNVAPGDVVGVETLRRGLRGDTLLDLVPGTVDDGLLDEWPAPLPSDSFR